MESLVIVVLIMVAIMTPIIIYDRRYNHHRKATKAALNHKLDIHFQEGEHCLHTFPKLAEGGIVCLTNFRIIHFHSAKFKLPFSIYYNNIKSIKRLGNKITITTKDERKQALIIYLADVARLYELIFHYMFKSQKNL